MSDYLEPARLASRVALDKKGENVALLDVRGHSDFADYLVLVTCRSSAHGKGVAQAVQRALDDYPLRRRGIEGYPDSPWILLDYYGVVVHLFGKDERDYYGLERRWPEAPAEIFHDG